MRGREADRHLKKRLRNSCHKKKDGVVSSSSDLIVAGTDTQSPAEMRKYIPTGTGAKECFNQIIRSYEVDQKYFWAVAYSRRCD